MSKKMTSLDIVPGGCACKDDTKGAKRTVDVSLAEHEMWQLIQKRRIWLEGEIMPCDMEEMSFPEKVSVADAVKLIMKFNDIDRGSPVSEREPIILYINSPGGNVTEGMVLVRTIEASETPVWTVNMGEWCSMGFLIGITGHRRLALPGMTFLMHDGNAMVWSSGHKAQDEAEFNKRILENIKKHVLKYSRLPEAEYDRRAKDEWFMFSEDAIKYGFIDEIVENLDIIL